MDKDNRILGEAIRAARLKKRLTQEQLAEMLDITPIHLKNIEGSRRKPSVPLLFQMMRILEFSVDSIVFSSQAESDVIYLDGLNEKEKSALTQLVDAIKNR